MRTSKHLSNSFHNVNYTTFEYVQFIRIQSCPIVGYSIGQFSPCSPIIEACRDWAIEFRGEDSFWDRSLGLPSKEGEVDRKFRHAAVLYRWRVVGTLACNGHQDRLFLLYLVPREILSIRLVLILSTAAG